MKNLNLSSIKVLGSTASTKIEVPAATPTHFFTAGRIVSYWPVVNANGYTFVKDDVAPLADTLQSSTVDIQHVKKGYGVKDALVAGEDNTIIGAIHKVLAHDDGIDICVKIERSVAQAFGFEPADFEPGTGILASYSQECEYDQNQSTYIVVDKSDPTKILKSMSFAEGQTLGLTTPSHMENGEWKYTMMDGNPVYIAVKPMSFSGVGHVARPADATAQVTKMVSGQPFIAFVPGMDSENNPVADMAKPFMVADEWSGNDLTQYTHDFVVHPDLISGVADNKVDKFHNEAEDPKAPDDHYAACWSETDYNNVVDGTPLSAKTRLYRIKSDKGDYDRGRCIAAYHSILGMRGNVTAAGRIPFNVRQHALARVRHGLNATKPKITKETSSKKMELTDEQLSARIRELSAAQSMSIEDTFKLIEGHKTLTEQVTSLQSSIADKDKAIGDKDAEITKLQASIKEREDADRANARLSTLEKILAFSEDEKKDEKFVEFTKNLASLSDTDFELIALRRELAAERAKPAPDVAPNRVLSGLNADTLLTNPVPQFDGGDGTKRAADVNDIY